MIEKMKKAKLPIICASAILLVSNAFMGANPVWMPAEEKVFTQTQENEELIRYDFLPETEMPLLGYVGIPPANAGNANNPSTNPSFMTRSNFQLYKDAGFNILSGLYERDPIDRSEIVKAFKLCDEFGLKYFITDLKFRCDSQGGTVANKSQEYYNNLMNNLWYLDEPAFAGIAMKDEPSAKDLDDMGKVNIALKAKTDGKIAYTTLFPNKVASNRLYLDDNSGTEWEKYCRYVEKYLNVVDPDVLCYDYYAFFKKGGTLDNTYNASDLDTVKRNAGKSNMEDYWLSLSYFSNLAKEHNVPMWVSVATRDHNRKTLHYYKQINWQVNTSLAYGAKGIQYYHYWTLMGGTGPEDWDNLTRGGMTTVNGTPHDVYYQIKKINQNIKMVDDVLMVSDHKGLIRYGAVDFIIQEKDLLYGYDVLSSVSGGDAIVGCFDNNGKSVYYIVNNSISSGTKTFKADFNKKVNVRLTNLSDGVRTASDVYSVGFNLSAGDAVLLEVL